VTIVGLQAPASAEGTADILTLVSTQGSVVHTTPVLVSISN
jgi:hypothetical protein